MQSSSASRKAKSKRDLGCATRRAVAAVIESLEHRTLLTTTVTPIADTFVRNNNFALTNFGASPLLFVENGTNGDSRIAFLKFDISQFTTIPSAILELSGSLLNDLGTPADTAVYPVADTSWDQGNGNIVDSTGEGFDTNPVPADAMTWSNQPAIGTTPIATATITRDSFQTYTFDVTSYLQQQLSAGNTVVSLAVEDITPTQEPVEFLSSKSSSIAGSGPQLVVADANPAPPTAFVSAPDVTAASDPDTELVTVTYSGSAPIDPSTIGPGNITVTPYTGGTGLSVALSGAPVQNADGSIVATYAVSDPGGAFTTADNGNFVVAVQANTANSVADLNGLGVTAATGSFNVSVGDTAAPTSAIAAPGITSAGGSTYSLTVTYNDNVAINASSIDLENVSLTGPIGPLSITGMTLNPSTNAAQIAATYTFTAPNGAWSAADDGQYTVTLDSGQVFDTAGNMAAENSANFNVSIPTPLIATVSAPNINTPGGATQAVTVVYSDNVAVDTQGITTSNIMVAGPGGAELNVTGVNVSGSGQLVTADYTVAAPGGAWAASDNGIYTITLPANAVTDASNDPLAAANATFSVNAAVVVIPPPTAVISAPAVSTAGGASEAITVVYTGSVPISIASIGTSNISVSGPAGPLTVTNFTVSGSGKTVTAVYTVAAPDGSWDATDDGTYNIALDANQVTDTSGNAAVVTFGSFAVNVPLPDPNDTTFNGGNPVTYPFVAQATATEPDGAILLVGYEQTASGQNEGVVECLNANGTVDTSFGTNGQVVTPAGNDQWFALTMQGANDFVVAGTDSGDFALARYNFNGSLDPTFGSQGVELTGFGSATDVAYSVALSPTGQIVAAGTANNCFAFARYDANGNIDNSFGEGGRQILDTGAATEAIGAVTVQNDGMVVGAGSSGASIDVVRLTASGDLDSTFNGDGLVAVPGLAADTSGTGADYTMGLALQGNGQIVVANRTAAGHFGVVRLNTDGTVDTTFGSDGLASADFGGEDEADSVVIQDSGAILVVGTSLQNSDPFTAVAALDSSGKLITTFGNDGMATFASATGSTTRELHIGQLVLRAFGSATTNGKLLVGASSAGGTQTVSSSLLRIIVPGTTSAPGIQETLLGVFGIVNGKQVNLKVALNSTQKAVFSLSGGTGTALQSGDEIHLEITSISGSVLSMTVTHGGTVTFSDIDVTGNLKGFHAPAGLLSGTLSVSGSVGNAVLGAIQGNVTIANGVSSFTGGNLAGTFSAAGSVGRLSLGAVSGNVDVTGNLANLSAGAVSGTIYSGGALGHAKVGSVTGQIVAATGIGSLYAASLDKATILAGANLGSDGLLGGTGSAMDTYGAGDIDLLHVAGAISASFIGAGVNPVDGIFGNGNDTSAGASLIKSIFAASADSTTRFESSAFGIARLPKKLVITTDPRFIVL